MLLGVLAVLVVAAWYALRPALVDPRPGGNAAAKINSYLDRTEVEGEAAWPIYREIIVEEFGYDHAEQHGTDAYRAMNIALGRLDVSAGEWSEAQFDEARAFLETYVGVLGRLHEAAQKPRFGKRLVEGGDALSGKPDPDGERLPHTNNMLLPELQPMKRMGSLLVLAMRGAAADERWDDYARHLDAAMGLGDHMLRDASLIGWSHGHDMIRDALREVRYTLQEQEFDREITRDLDRAIRFDPVGSLAGRFECERRLALDNLDRVYGSNGFLVGWRWSDYTDGMLESLPMINLHLRVANLSAWFHPRHDASRDAMNAHYDRHVDRARALDDHPWLEAIADHPFVEPKNNIIREMVYGYRSAYIEYAQLTRDRAATVLMLQIEARMSETGSPPENMHEHFLETEPTTGMPFLYEPGEDGYSLSAASLPVEMSGEDRIVFTGARPEAN